MSTATATKSVVLTAAQVRAALAGEVVRGDDGRWCWAAGLRGGKA